MPWKASPSGLPLFQRVPKVFRIDIPFVRIVRTRLWQEGLEANETFLYIKDLQGAHFLGFNFRILCWQSATLTPQLSWFDVHHFSPHFWVEPGTRGRLVSLRTTYSERGRCKGFGSHRISFSFQPTRPATIWLGSLVVFCWAFSARQWCIKISCYPVVNRGSQGPFGVSICF